MRSGDLVRTGDGHDPARCLAFTSANQSFFPIATMARVLVDPVSSFDAWRRRPPSRHQEREAEFLVALRTAHARSDGTYGAPRLLADRRDLGYRVAQTCIASLLRQDGHRGVSKRRGASQPTRATPET